MRASSTSAAHLPRMREDAIQAALINHIALRARPGVKAFHVPNGGKRSKAEAGRFKALGVVRGIPDLVVIADGRALFLELKATDGRLSPDQVKAHAELKTAGAIVATVFGLDAAIDQLKRWGVLR
jgi:hypothetical protein